ncbi:MAG: parallel beta-helix repeat-containing protein [Parcubacteria group bacterium Gr01-1014_17]|nr:MAG: parallel beta-helix repeat-containing protein [Parcubacteria group bacterium Gr01-1014_17]
MLKILKWGVGVVLVAFIALVVGLAIYFVKQDKTETQVEKIHNTNVVETGRGIAAAKIMSAFASIFESTPIVIDNTFAGAAIALVNIVPEPVSLPSNIPRNVGISEQVTVVPQKTKTAIAPPPKAAAPVQLPLTVPAPPTIVTAPTPSQPTTNPIYDPFPIPIGPDGFRGGGGGGGGGSTSLTTSSTSASPAPAPAPTPTPYVPSAGDIVLNEIYWYGSDIPATGSEDEWIELYNKTSNTVSLSGWTLYSADGAPYIQLSGSIASGVYYLIERKNSGETNEASESPIANVTADLWTSFGSGLGDMSGEHLYLSYFSGTATSTIDELDFSACGGWCGIGGGGNYLSMERKAPDVSGLTSDGWAANRGDRNNIKNGTDQAGGSIRGTPRARNYANYLVNYGSDLTSGTLTLTATGSPYFVDNAWFTVANGATLSLQSGAVIKFLSTAGIKVNGNLTTSGTASSPSIFTSYFDDTYGGDFNRDGSNTSPQAGDWYGIQYLAGSTGTLSYGTVRYGGKFSGGEQKANIYITNSSPTISNSIIEYGKTYGIYLDTASSTVSSNTIRYHTTDTPSYGIYGSGGAPAISSNTITDNSYGMNFWDTRGTISSNTFTNNTSGAFTWGGGLSGSGRIQNNSGSSNGQWNGVRLSSGNLLSAGATSTFSKNTSFPYIIPSTITIPTGAGLIAEAGSVWKTDRYSLEVYGRLEAQGTPSNPVIFTNWADDSDGSDVHGTGSTTPIALNPSGIYLKPNATSDFLNTTIRYMDIGLNYDSSPISLENVSFIHNSTGLSAAVGAIIVKAINVSFEGNVATSTVQLP